MQPQPIIRMKAISKRFNGVTASDDVDFDLFPGEVHTLLGENGAGKSTLMHILSGLVQPDTGSIEVRGEAVNMRSPADSLGLGIGMVYQHFALVPNLTVMENIILGFEEKWILDRKRAERAIHQIFKELKLSLPLDEKVTHLSVGEKQRVEIVKALYHKSHVLILDEPTSVLTPIESEELFKMVRSMRRLGKAVVFITHKLKEALGISDRISILRLGKKVAEFSGKELRGQGEKKGYQQIFNVMFNGVHRSIATTASKRPPGELPVLALDRVVCLGNSGEQRLKDCSLQINRGEIFGIAGVDGNGQKELAEIIAGQRKCISGRLLLYGEDISRSSSVKARTDLGISYITDDRMQEGCALSMSVAENSILRLFERVPFSRRKIMNKKHIHKYTEDLIREFDISVSGPDADASKLSGGNIQKLLLARELSMKPRVLVCNKPTQGLDEKTTLYVQDRLRQARSLGAAVLYISSDVDELLNCSDRIGVLFEGKLLDVISTDNADRETIGKLMLGIRP